MPLRLCAVHEPMCFWVERLHKFPPDESEGLCKYTSVDAVCVWVCKKTRRMSIFHSWSREVWEWDEKKQVLAHLVGFCPTVRAADTMILGFRHINTTESQPGFLGVHRIDRAKPYLPLSLSCADPYTTQRAVSQPTSVSFLLLPFPTHLFSWLGWPALFCAQRLRAGEPLWRGIAFNRDEVCLSSLSAPVLSHRVLGARCSAPPLCVMRGPSPGKADDLPQVDSICLYLCCILLFKSTVETSVWRRRELFPIGSILQQTQKTHCIWCCCDIGVSFKFFLCDRASLWGMDALTVQTPQQYIIGFVLCRCFAAGHR